jgi:erythromycin esterase-like protein
MPTTTDAALVRAIDKAAHELTTSAADYSMLVDRVGDAPCVLLGEGSHGTHEFYRERAQITKRLIEEKGFNIVAIEGDWPDAYRVNRYVRHAVLHFDETRAVEPLEVTAEWEKGEVPETFPFAV